MKSTVRRLIEECRQEHFDRLFYITSMDAQNVVDKAYTQYEIAYFNCLCDEKHIWDDTRLDLAAELGIGSMDWLYV